MVKMVCRSVLLTSAEAGADINCLSALSQFAHVDIYVGVLAFCVHLCVRHSLHRESLLKQLLETRVDAV